MDYLYVKAGVVAGIVFMALDALWLGVIAKSFYKEQLGSLLTTQPDWLMALCVYIFMIAGFLWFVFPQVQMTRSVLQAMQYGARFGVIVFGVYECTNAAIIAGWPVYVVVIDTIWGGILYAVVSAAVFYLRNIMI
jgi:uncharacterized membrane protein